MNVFSVKYNMHIMFKGRPMTETEIQAFLQVIQTGSITAAAEHLYITQPALSRRLRSLENELGCKLFFRGPGQQAVELTPQGQAFIPVAEKWLEIWAQARELNHPRPRELTVSSVGSMGTYLLPPVFRAFMAENPDCRLNLHSYHSAEAYDYVADGDTALAFISTRRYHRTVDSIPAYREPLVLVAMELPELPGIVHPTMLDPGQEVRLPWNPEYDSWHDYWFDPAQRPKVYLDQMSLMEEFMQEPGSWAILPSTVAVRLTTRPGLQLHRVEQGPPDRVIYYLTRKGTLSPEGEEFLRLLAEHLRSEQDVECFL